MVLLLAYGAGLFFSLRTHAHLYTAEQEETLHGTPRWSVRRVVILVAFNRDARSVLISIYGIT